MTYKIYEKTIGTQGYFPILREHGFLLSICYKDNKTMFGYGIDTSIIPIIFLKNEETV